MIPLSSADKYRRKASRARIYAALCALVAVAAAVFWVVTQTHLWSVSVVCFALSAALFTYTARTHDNTAALMSGERR